MLQLFEKKWFAGLTLLIVVLIGFYIRFDNIYHWLEHKPRYFFGNPELPLMLTVDAYYYLDIAKQLQAEVYEAFDARRQVPNGFYRTTTPPLLSVLLASLSSWVGKPIEWVALVVSPVLGALLAIPVYLLGYTLTLKAKVNWIDSREQRATAHWMGLVAALFAVLSPKLVSRSSPGWFDTDNLNVFFPVLIAWLCIKFADAVNSKQRNSFLVAIILIFLLFLWWWEQSFLPVLLLTGLPLLTAIIWIGKRNIRDLVPMALICIVLIALLGIWQGFSVLNSGQHLLTSIKGTFSYITSDTSDSVFFAAGNFVSEQRKTPFPLLVKHTSGGQFAFWLACAGLLLLIWKTRLYSLFLLAIAAVAVLSVTGQRFLIFSAPLFGLGIASLAVIPSYSLKSIYWKIPVITLLLVSAGWGAVTRINEQEQMVPRRMPVLFDAMVEIRQQTEKNAVLWASWGHGHPLVHYTERGTIGDGISHPASLQYVTDVPLATDNFRLSANWIQFYVAQGYSGLTKANQLFSGTANGWDKGMTTLKQLLGSGVQGSREVLKQNYAFTDEKTEQTLEFLFPDSPPIYLFLEYLLLGQPWFHLGNWDFATRSGIEKYMYLTIDNVSRQANGRLRGYSRLGAVHIDTEKGIIQVGQRTQPLRLIKIQNGREFKVKKYKNRSSAVVNLIGSDSGQFAVLGSHQTSNTVLTRLYFEIPLSQPYFIPAMIEMPYYSIWKVNAERYTALNHAIE